ncbi:GntR family transcriptional regulator [Paraburkholderia pallida]|uniref:GntR family transcriptional regulator n=1 Tax=Paraburkholderia pallida TaxID=2547399 RepID=A0A4P7DAE9_9BURK|nr:GntR family transcriptional regulator [Paraburkholderia pallida]QBR04105.1 GntR family transcriptional regulator [Paraburkholderia pallida]
MSEPVQKAKAMERALQHLRGKVMSGALMPGEQIRQQEMAEELGVSRVPLREALNLLADQGLLVHRPNSGYFVAKRAPDELAQIMRILQLLENELLASVQWPDDTHIAQLQALNDQMRAIAASADWTPLVRLNREFHMSIYALSPYKIILEEVKRLWTMADSFIATTMSDTRARVQTVKEHDQLIASLAAHNRTSLFAAMDVHRASTAGDLSPGILMLQTLASN